MPTIAKTTLRPGRTNLTETTLDGTTDGFTYSQSRGEILTLRNPTAAALSPVIDGADAGVVQVPGVGSINISGGFAVGSIAAGGAAVVNLDSIREYLVGTIAVTGGAGLVATLITS